MFIFYSLYEFGLSSVGRRVLGFEVIIELGIVFGFVIS